MERSSHQPSDSNLRLQLRGISKQYPGCLANDQIDLEISAGEIHALLGEYGAGKSTLMKIIYGVTNPDAGQIIWEGEQVEIKNPLMARHLGIGMVFQHFSLFETLTVMNNSLENENIETKEFAKKIKNDLEGQLHNKEKALKQNVVMSEKLEKTVDKLEIEKNELSIKLSEIEKIKVAPPPPPPPL